MNKLYISIALGVLAVSVVAGAIFVKNSQQQTSNGEAQMQNNQASDDKFNGTFLELLALGENYTCSFNQVVEDGNTMSGTVYIASSGDKLNGKFSVMQADNTQVDANVIRDGEYNYVWTSDQQQGFKTKITAEDNSVFGPTTSSSGITDEDKVNFDCKPWNVDNSMFAPPSDIEFTDFSSMMPTSTEKPNFAGYDEKVDCSVCDSIPAGSGKEQCLQTLGC